MQCSNIGAFIDFPSLKAVAIAERNSYWYPQRSRLSIFFIVLKEQKKCVFTVFQVHYLCVLFSSRWLASTDRLIKKWIWQRRQWCRLLLCFKFIKSGLVGMFIFDCLFVLWLPPVLGATKLWVQKDSSNTYCMKLILVLLAS